MTDSPPQLGQIPQQSGFKIPTLSSNMEGSIGSQQVANAKASIYNSKVGFSPLPITNNAGTNIDTCSTLPARVTAPESLPRAIDASAAANTVQNHPATQSAKDTLSNG